jgi:hypothetical protein
MASVPSPAELRALVEAQGVTPTDRDLEAVRAFLEILLPAWEELERSIPPDTVPAGLFAPPEDG